MNIKGRLVKITEITVYRNDVSRTEVAEILAFCRLYAMLFDPSGADKYIFSTPYLLKVRKGKIPPCLRNAITKHIQTERPLLLITVVPNK